MAFGADGFTGYLNPERVSVRDSLDDAVTD